MNTSVHTLSFIPAGSGPDASTLHHLLVDQVLPRLLAHDGRLVLHAGAATDASGAVALVGPSGLGKSTLTASLAQHGFSLLSDDAIIADSDPATRIEAVCRGLRLRPDSLDALYPESVATTPMAEYSPKRRLLLESSAGDDAHPLDLVILLEPPPPEDAIAVRPLTQAETCMRLIANSFALDPTDRPSAARRLARASALAASVPAFALSYPRQYDRLPAVRAAILSILEEVRGTGRSYRHEAAAP